MPSLHDLAMRSLALADSKPGTPPLRLLPDPGTRPARLRDILGETGVPPEPKNRA